jgi:hypothetical protein
MPGTLHTPLGFVENTVPGHLAVRPLRKPYGGTPRGVAQRRSRRSTAVATRARTTAVGCGS